jgi:hypothetical protein
MTAYRRALRLVALTAAVTLAACTSTPVPGESSRSESSPSPTPDGVEVLDRGLVDWEDGVVLDDPHAARRYEVADKPEQYDCIGIGSGPSPREVIAFDDYPTVREVPGGYQWRPPTWDDARRVVTRSWGSRARRLTLEIGPGKQLQSLPAVLRRGRVNGEPATVTRVIMLSCARWGPPDLTLNLCSRDDMAGDPPLNPDELLGVASSVG